MEEIAKYAPAEAVSALRDAFDFNLYFFGNSVSPAVCVAVLGGSVILLAAAYYLIVHFSARRKSAESSILRALDDAAAETFLASV